MSIINKPPYDNFFERKSTGSTISNFENAIKDTNLFDTNILDYLEKEFLQNENNLFQQETENL